MKKSKAQSKPPQVRARIDGDTVRMTLDPSNVRHYELFLRAKAMPKFRVIGRTVEFPAEYAAEIGLRARADDATEYRSRRGLFDYQRDITRWAIRKRKAATFVRPGLGKTFMQSEFARHASAQLPEGKRTLMIAPPMVVPQTLTEIASFYGKSLAVEQVKAAQLADWLSTPGGGIGITNYEALKDDTPQGHLGALILDESSVLKSHYGKWGQICIRLGRGLEWKLAGTGTPAPNDRIEYANHAVFLDQFPTVNSFLARYFVNRGQTENRWELKPHALAPFYRTLSHWAFFLNSPATYGWRDNSKPLPPISVHVHDVPLTDRQRELASTRTGTLFGHAGGITSRTVLSQIAKGHYQGEEIPTAKPRFIRDLIESWPRESTLIWCLYNREQDSLEREMPSAGSIRGETPYAERLRIIDAFKARKIRTLISKPDILGFGLNLQVATRQVFSGLQDSYEEYYQAVMRSNRVGSTKPLNVHIPVTLIERPMIETVLRKADRVQQDTEEQERIFKEEGITHVAA